MPPVWALVSRARRVASAATHGVSAEQYRELVGLRPRHPLCAPQQSAVRAARLHTLIATDERVQRGMSDGAALARAGDLQRRAQQRFAERRLSIERERQLAASGSALGSRRAARYRQLRESRARALGFPDLRDYYATRYHAQRATLDDLATELECALSAIRGDFGRLGLRIERHRSYGARWGST
jgi:hypothetical protein